MTNDSNESAEYHGRKGRQKTQTDRTKVQVYSTMLVHVRKAPSPLRASNPAPSSLFEVAPH